MFHRPDVRISVRDAELPSQAGPGWIQSLAESRSHGYAVALDVPTVGAFGTASHRNGFAWM